MAPIKNNSWDFGGVIHQYVVYAFTPYSLKALSESE